MILMSGGGRRELLLGDGGAPSWVSRADGIAAAMDVDFANDRAWLGGVPKAIASILPSTVGAYDETGLLIEATDNFSMLVSSIPVFSQSAGSLFADYTLNELNVSSAQEAIRLESDNNNAIALRANNASGSAGLVAINGGAAQSFCDFAGASTNPAKQAGAWALNDFANVLNGGSPVTDSSGTIPAVTTLYVGSDGGFNALLGRMRRFAYWSFRVSNGGLQALTS